MPRNTVKVLPNSLNDSDGYDLVDRFEDAEPVVQAPENLEGHTELIGQKVAKRKKGTIQKRVVTCNPGGTVLPLGEATCPPIKSALS